VKMTCHGDKETVKMPWTVNSVAAASTESCSSGARHKHGVDASVVRSS
jgi:hypothetical protein